jgi:hypothetical protein
MNGDEIVSFPERGGEASHLSYEEMEAWLDGRADDIDGELAEGHVALCPRCAAEAEDLRRVRKSVTPQRRWWMAAAAAIVLIALLTIPLFKQPRTIETPVVATHATTAVAPTPVPRTLAKPAILAALITKPGTMRGTSERAKLELEAPVATVVLDARPFFRWTAAEGASEYEVAVADRETGEGAATGWTKTTSWRPDEPLARGRLYTWQVTAHAGEERWVVPKPPDAEAVFYVARPETVQEIEAVPESKPLDRGIVLAEHGVLDDAERELKRAAEAGDRAAEDMLETVQSWRVR